MAEIFVGIPWGNEKLNSTTRKEHILGQLGLTPDGRVHRFYFADGAVTAGKLLAQKAPTGNHDMDLSVQAAAAAGDTTISVTLGATAATLNQYEDGIIYINDGTGEGQLFRIRSNPAADASATLTVTLHEKVVTALTTADSLAGLIENPYKDVVVHPTTTVGRAVGFTNADTADDEYAWCCSRGDVAALINGTVVIGETVSAGATTAGSVDATNYGGTVESPIVGYVTSVVAVTTDYGHIYATID